MSFDDDLAAQEAAPKPTAEADVLLNGTPYLLRFTQMSGFDWAAECDRHPARPGVLLDMRYGYNLRSLVMAVAPKTGARVEGDKDVRFEEEKWQALLSGIDGSAFQRVSDAIWSLNEYGPSQAVEAAKKALSDSEKPSV